MEGKPLFYLSVKFRPIRMCGSRFGEVVAGDLSVAAVEELRFCEVDTSKNKKRKRKICEACHGRIATELKCMRLEVSIVNHFV